MVCWVTYPWFILLFAYCFMHSFSYCFWLLICFMLWFLLCSICIYQFYLFVFICLSSIFIAFDLYASSFQLIFIWSPLYLVSLGLILFLQHAFCMHDMLLHVRLSFTFPYQFNNESHVPYRINYQFGKFTNSHLWFLSTQPSNHLPMLFRLVFILVVILLFT